MSREEQTPAPHRLKMEAARAGLGWWDEDLHGRGCGKVPGAELGVRAAMLLPWAKTSGLWSLGAAGRVLPMISGGL